MKLFCLIMVLIVSSSIPLSYSQLILGDPAVHKLITINVGKEGEIHVIHEIKRPRSTVHVETIEGIVTNLNVIDIKGNNVEFGVTGLDSTTGVTVFPSQDDVIIEYDLTDILFFNDGIWSMKYYNEETTKIIFPEGVDLLFVNDRPVMLHDAKGITCYGRSQGAICDAFIEYILDEPTKMINVKWEERKFDVEIRTMADISSFNFDQPTKRISFDINEKDPFITLIIPLELLWKPYEVYLNEEKILKHEFFSNETHSWLNVRPNNSGTIEIIGTTVVPEFPILAPLVVGMIIVISIQLKNRFSLH